MADYTNISSVNYTDKDMQILSQLAYVDFEDEMIGLTFSDILNNSKFYEELYERFILNTTPPDPGSSAEADYNWKLGVLELLKNDEKYSNWKLVDVQDLNDTQGMYAILVETDEDSAIVAFRGSDSLSNDEYVLTDWIAADGALILDGENTVQQDFATQYMADYISQLGYDNLAMTGHSLGGNLAMHSKSTAA